MFWFWKKKKPEVKEAPLEPKFKLRTKKEKVAKSSKIVQLHLPNEVIEIRLMGWISSSYNDYSAVTGKLFSHHRDDNNHILKCRFCYPWHPDTSVFDLAGKNYDFYTFPINNQTHTYPKEMIKKIVIFDGPEEMVEVEVDEVVPV